MFCPTCGAESAIELNYCNRCGANLSSALLATTNTTPISVTRPVFIIGAVMLFITLGGFAGVLSTAIEIATKVGGGDLTMAIVVVGMLTVLTVDVLLFRLLSRLINAALATHKGAAKNLTTKSQDQAIRAPDYCPIRTRAERDGKYDSIFRAGLYRG